jgi:S-layer homology domain
MSRLWYRAPLVAGSVLAVALTSVSLAQDVASGLPQHAPAVPVSRPATPPTLMVPEYGTGSFSVSSMWAGGMTVAYNPATIFSKNNGSGYYYMTSNGDDLVGSFSVPSGVTLEYIGLENCDTVGGHYSMYLFDGDTLVSNFTTSAKGGCGWEYGPGGFNYNFDANQYHSLNVYINQNGPTDGSDGVRGMNIWWVRRVSPAPGSPSFGDVSTGDSGYQYIQALVAAGVTGGCGSGNYCPDGTLTRRQMAVFVAKALGLFWPN